MKTKYQYFGTTSAYELKLCLTCDEEVWMLLRQKYCSYRCRPKINVPKGKDHPLYKEGPNLRKDDTSYYVKLHNNVRTERGYANACINGCKVNCTYQWANLTGAYEDIYDYVMMCRACHNRFDHRRVAVIRIPNE